MKKLDTDRIVQLIFQKRAEQEPPKRTRPYLIIAPNRLVFEHYCIEHKLEFHNRPFEAVHVYRPEHLFGRDHLIEDVIVLDYPNGERGDAIRETVEVLLAREKDRKKE